MQATSDASKAALIESWKSTEAVPIDQAVFSGSSSTWLGSILMYFARNPVYLVGVFYFVKRFFKYLEELGQSKDIDGGKEL